MKSTALISLSLAAIASASIAERGTGSYQQVLQSITTAVTNLDSAVINYTGADKQPVVDAADALVKAMNNGTTTMEGLPQVDASEALPLSSSVLALSTKSQTLIDDLKNKRSNVENAGQCSAVRVEITEINSSAQNLTNVALNKVPQSFQSLAATYLSQLNKSFNETQDYFSASNCKDNEGSGNSSTSAGSSTTSPTSTSSMTSSQAAASPSHTGGSSITAPSWTLGSILFLFAVYY